jgi:8-oxo-dGTP pyrophosphatase MutT (NUDIX family)
VTHLPPEQVRLAAVADGRRDVWNPPPPRRAATVALLRDAAAGLEVYLLQRAATMAAAPDMHVFPGGGVNTNDGAVDDPGTLIRAAVREVAEETGVHLPHGDQLVRFARWITPEVLPHRHDTDFFAVVMPPDQVAGVLGTEAASADWWQPAHALAAADAGHVGLLPPTAAALAQLAVFSEVADALAGLARLPVPALMPAPYRDEERFNWRVIDVETGHELVDPTNLGLPAGWRPPMRVG